MALADDRSRQLALGISVAAVLIAIGAGWIFQSMHQAEPIVKGPGVTADAMLSATAPNLTGTDGDTPVFTMQGDTPGGTFVLLGGTHPQEIGGMMAAILMVENARVTQGKMIVIPQANRSGFTHTDPMEAYAHTFTIDTPGGPRWFRVGMRLTNPADQWPDPDAYVHIPSGERMVGHESRNLNRNHPGLQTGTLTTEVSYGITQLVNGANIVLDLHEAQPEYPVINKIITHENAQETAATATMMLEFEGVSISLDPSPRNLHGLSHREFGDHTNAEAILAEAPNPSMGRFRGRLSNDLVVGGRDANYVRAAQLGRLFIPFTEEGWPLEVRVARHLATIAQIIDAYNGVHPDAPIVIENIPAYQDVIDKGLGAFLNPPPSA
jgi:hypothetical protein